MRSQRPRDAHFFRFPKGSPQAGHTFDSRVPDPSAPRPPDRRATGPPAQGRRAPRTCFQNFEKLRNGLSGRG